MVLEKTCIFLIRGYNFKMKILIRCAYSVLFMLYGLLWASLFTHAQSISDEDRLKSRVVAIHAKYTASWDHDIYLNKLQEAKKSMKSYPARQLIDMIIAYREELRPQQKTRANGVSSIPQEVVVNAQTAEISSEQLPKEEMWSSELKQDQHMYQLTHGRINITILQDTWMWWVNELRVQRWRAAYVHEPVLDKTAADRSETMKKKWVADHRRFANSAYYAYYAYGEIEQRFSKRGVEFVNVSRATFTENIWRATFRCKKADCTDDAINAMRQSWNFYLSEEWTTNDVHWRTLTHPLFTLLGLGIAVDESAGKFYLTTHYGTEIK